MKSFRFESELKVNASDAINTGIIKMSVVFAFCGPAITKKVSKRCQKTIKKLSKTKKYQKTVKNVSKRYQKTIKSKKGSKTSLIFSKKMSKTYPISKRYQKGVKHVFKKGSKIYQIFSFGRFLSPFGTKAKAQGHEQYVKTVLR